MMDNPGYSPYGEIPLEQDYHFYGNNHAQETFFGGQKMLPAADPNQMTFDMGFQPQNYGHSTPISENEFSGGKLQFQMDVDQPEQSPVEQRTFFQPTSAVGLMGLDFEYTDHLAGKFQSCGGNNEGSELDFFRPPDSNENWGPILPVQEQERDDEVRKMKREKNKKYSAACLLKKKSEEAELQTRSTQLILDYENLKQDAADAKANFCFAVNHVLSPILGDNNLGNNEQNDEISILAVQFEIEEEQITSEVDLKCSKDHNVINMAAKLAEAQKKWDAAEYDKKHKNKSLKTGTFGSRCTRAKAHYHVCLYSWQIAQYSYEFDKQQRLLEVYQKFWNKIRLMTCQILNEFSGTIEENCMQNGRSQELMALRYFLFRDAG